MNRFTFILLFIFIIYNSLIAQQNEKNILVLHSYHKGLSWTEKVIQGIESIFQNKILTTYNLKIYYEYMDTKRFEDPDYIQLLIPLYKYKASKVKYDVIIAVDDNALNFLLKNRNHIFGEVPVIFCGINFYDEERIHSIKKITGVIESFSAKDNIDLILKLHPDTKKIVVVGDNTLTSQLNNKVLKNIERDFPQLQFEYLTSGNLNSYRKFLNSLDKHVVILAMLFNLDHNNKFYTYEESFKFYSAGVKLPIYTFWDFYIGLGSIGGKIISGFSQGEVAAKLALDVLNGEDPDTIPIISTSPNVYIFDYNQLQTFNINRDLLPEDSTIINQPINFKDFYNKYKFYINVIIFIFLILVIIIIILIFNIQQRKKVQKQLLETNNAYYRFVPKEFLSYLGKKEITEVKLGDAIEKEFTVLFSDIRNFTTISESMTPQENFRFVNEYLKYMGPAIRMHNGFIDKFIGDAIMALFPDPNDAIKASLEMLNRLYDVNQYLQKQYQNSISIGVGIHSGSLMMGTVGETFRMDSTVISDVVNVSSRLESLTKIYGSKVICSSEVKDALGVRSNYYSFRYLGKVLVKGKQKPVVIYEILDGEEHFVKEEKIRSKNDVERAIQFYENNEIEEALKILEPLSKQYPEDRTIQYIYKKIQVKKVNINEF